MTLGVVCPTTVHRASSGTRPRVRGHLAVRRDRFLQMETVLAHRFVRGPEPQPAAAFWRARKAATLAREEQRSEQ